MPAVAEEDHDPFGVLRNANTVLLHNLRRDELSPELQKQLTATGMASTSQAYFCDPYTNSYLGPQVTKAASRRAQQIATLFEFVARGAPFLALGERPIHHKGTRLCRDIPPTVVISMATISGVAFSLNSNVTRLINFDEEAYVAVVGT